MTPLMCSSVTPYLMASALARVSLSLSTSARTAWPWIDEPVDERVDLGLEVRDHPTQARHRRVRGGYLRVFDRPGDRDLRQDLHLEAAEVLPGACRPPMTSCSICRRCAPDGRHRLVADRHPSPASAGPASAGDVRIGRVARDRPRGAGACQRAAGSARQDGVVAGRALKQRAPQPVSSRPSVPPGCDRMGGPRPRTSVRSTGTAAALCGSTAGTWGFASVADIGNRRQGRGRMSTLAMHAAMNPPQSASSLTVSA